MKPYLFKSVMLLFLTLLIGAPAEAHNQSRSFSFWNAHDGHLNMLFKIRSREITRLDTNEGAGLETLLVRHLSQTIRVSQGGFTCTLDETKDLRAMMAESGFFSISANFNCPSKVAVSPFKVAIGSFFSLVPSHIHFARFSVGDDMPLEYIYSEGLKQHTIDVHNNSESAHNRTGFFNYILLGARHILTGMDHVMFLLALLLMLPTLRELIWLMSGFTLGHSITLSLAVLGWFSPDNLRVEALIGFTIALVSAENIAIRNGSNRQITYATIAILVLMIVVIVAIPRPSAMTWLSLVGLIVFSWSYLPEVDEISSAIRLRPMLSLVFGLIHGLAFASVLRSFELSSESLWSALMGFNIGVELGQLLIIFGVWLFYLVLKPYKNIFSSFPDMCSALLCGAGLYWFVTRSLEPVVR